MSNIEPRKILWVENPNQLLEMVEEFKTEPIIGVDTESDSLYVYFEKVCLIQFSTPYCDYLVDPLSIDNLFPLNEIFNNPNIEKVFHAAEYDVMCLKRDFKFEFTNIFDTMIASRILGKNAFGLGNLLKDYFGIVVDKKFQRANWGKRPLTDEMLNYASMDSHYLINLRNLLFQELSERKLLALAKEDFNRTCDLDSFQPHKDGEQCWKMIKGNHIKPQQMAVFMELCEFRERIARDRNIPAFKVVNSDVLVEIAKNCPLTFKELSEMPGIAPKIVGRYGDDFIRCVHAGLENEPVYRQHRTKPNDAYLQRYETIKIWRKNMANILQVESDVVLPKDKMELIAQKNPKTINDLKGFMLDTPFRFEKFGNEILSLLLEIED
ncbi:MAG: hypothetical protein CVU46_15955 [Chloroflexi bacterium HGW-Chloroflexi-8]|nr:MAG: hypothetical protein CVU46_15955 [Chloroflexi bacterium HGW-Chloroflexi-8]